VKHLRKVKTNEERVKGEKEASVKEKEYNESK